jgi:hypothetical protein
MGHQPAKGRTLRILDDRGVDRPLLDLRGDEAPSLADNPAARRAIERSLRKLRPRWSSKDLLAAAIGLTLVVCYLIVQLAYSHPYGFKYPLKDVLLRVGGVSTVVFVAGLAWVAFSWFVKIGRYAPPDCDTIRRDMLSVGLCPSCGTDLPDEVGPDGCAVCPWCSAAWRATDSESPAAARCRCGYRLAGLPHDAEGLAACPECGLHHVLNPELAARVGLCRCWNCGRSLRGLELQYGDRVQCPGCGQWRSGLTAGNVGEAAGEGR